MKGTLNKFKSLIKKCKQGNFSILGKFILVSFGTSALGNIIGILLHKTIGKMMQMPSYFGEILFTVIGILIGIVLLVICMKKMLLNPLKELGLGMTQISEGNFDIEVEVKSTDEVGKLMEEFNQMVENMKKPIKDIQDPLDILIKMSEGLNSISEQTNIATHEIAKTMEDVASNAMDQASNAEICVSAMEELGNTMESISKKTSTMNEFAQKASEDSKLGYKIVNLLTNKSEENSQVTLEVNQIVQNVDNSIKHIGTITEVIKQIASQINLLALNAAIESARAGEAGRGFAVVADEVRKLAEQSSKAVNEIEGLISNIQQESNIAVNAMEQVIYTVKEQDEAVHETEKVFDDITYSIDALLEKVVEVKEHSEEMINMKFIVTEAIENVSAISQETAAATEQVSANNEENLASIEEISSHSGNLNEVVNTIKVSIDNFNI
ncbi:methyl-accepting chemotaxis protein [Tissierella sp. MB52-C2]|uniref:methyl-accepting chemotaxis protein n=1 Tax=Tissierella sp. MB52-C2 TaxID=3070999 RepID=UPI00280A770F|nr:methyl-accepting chemotaxis protein [Tissierella sp. MB52-C2]WMM24789.1 methyl-accepting chemotaxis protein [Tissierella sp. MB52-C2]